MKIYEFLGQNRAFDKGEWIKSKTDLSLLKCWREIDPDQTIAHSIELESCTAVITAESCYFRDAAAPVITLEEMQRVTKCMEMLREAVKLQRY